MNLGGAELLILLAIVALLFGASWVPKAARNLGRAKVELDKTQRQIADTKRQVVEATGIEQLDSTIRKANRALNTTPKGLLKNAATAAFTVTPSAGATEDDIEDNIEDAEIVEMPDASAATSVDTRADTNLNVDFSD